MQLSRVRGGRAGQSVCLEIDPLNGQLKLATPVDSRHRNSHGDSVHHFPTPSKSAVHLAAQLAHTTPPTATGYATGYATGAQQLSGESPTNDGPQRASDKPLILSTRDARRGQIVAAVNLAGRQAGIRPAMRLSEATAFVEAEVHPHDPQEDIQELCVLAEQAQQFSPLVGLEQLDKKLWAGRTLPQPECLLLDVTGLPACLGVKSNCWKQFVGG